MNKKNGTLVLLLVLCLALVACSASATESPRDEIAPQAIQESIVLDKAAEAPMEAPAAEMAAPPAIFATQAPAAQGGSSGMAAPIGQIPGQMVIKDARMDLEVENTDRAINDVTNLAANQGGYIISANTWFDGDQKFATISMGVPSGNFERTLTFLRAIGLKVISETASGQDVTAEYNDLQIRLENLEATAARVRSFLEEAKTVEELLRINATLSDLEGQINQIKGQMKFYEGRSAYSTIEVALNPLTPTPTITPTPTQTPTPTPWNPGATIPQCFIPRPRALAGYPRRADLGVLPRLAIAAGRWLDLAGHLAGPPQPEDQKSCPGRTTWSRRRIIPIFQRLSASIRG